MTEPLPGRPDRFRASIDWAVDLTVATFSLMAAVVLQREVAGGGVSAGLAVAAVHGGIVVLRRRHPIPVLAVLVATAALYVALGFPAYMLGPAVLFAMYSAGTVLTGRAVAGGGRLGGPGGGGSRHGGAGVPRGATWYR